MTTLDTRTRSQRSPRRSGWPLPRIVAILGALALLLAACPADDDEQQADEPAAEEPAAEEPAQISIIENAAVGGKNNATAEWLTDDVIPAFEEMMREEQGREVSVEFVTTGIDDDDYKSRLALDLRVGEGADLMGFDQFWVAEFHAAGFVAPLREIVGDAVDDWDGWDRIPEAVQGSFEIGGERFGLPAGTDGRTIFYRRDLLEQAGLPGDWQPTSWEDVLDAARTIQDELPDVTPLQVNAGTSMGEATTLQGIMLILLGTGAELYDDDAGQWLGNTPEFREMLGFFEQVYLEEGLGDAELQLQVEARDRTFEMFANGEIAILMEGDFFWRSVITPEDGLWPIENRDEVTGWALIPAREPGAGIRGQDFVSASGGTGRIINPNTAHPDVAWEFMKFLGGAEMTRAFVEREPRITSREDVNQEVIDDPMLSFIADEVLPITWYRPGFEEYPEVSRLLQEVVEDLVAGRASLEETAQNYDQQLRELVGDDNVRTEE